MHGAHAQSSEYYEKVTKNSHKWRREKNVQPKQ